MKVHYIDKLFKNSEIVVWGAGPRGKGLVKELLKINIEFKWITDNLKKIGKSIYGIEVQTFNKLKLNDSQVFFLAITQRDCVEPIKKILDSKGINQYFEI